MIIWAYSKISVEHYSNCALIVLFGKLVFSNYILLIHLIRLHVFSSIAYSFTSHGLE